MTKNEILQPNDRKGVVDKQKQLFDPMALLGTGGVVKKYGAGGIANGAGGNATGAMNAYISARIADIEKRRLELQEQNQPVANAINAAGALGTMAGGIGTSVAAFKGSSDIRIKDVINEAEALDPIETIAAGLNPFYYVYKPGVAESLGIVDDGQTRLGISAQELVTIPGIGSVSEDPVTGVLTVDPAQQCLFNVAAIAQLCKSVIELRGIITELLSVLSPQQQTQEQTALQQLTGGSDVPQ